MRRLAFLLFFSFTSACTTSAPLISHQSTVRQHDANIALFLDGTRNDQDSETNVSRIYDLARHQNRNDIIPLYVKGVGTGARVIGLSSGWGVANDAEQSYQFLAENYQRSGDKIFIFGFSRGAFVGRVLAGLIESAGLPDLSTLTEREKKKFIRKLYKAYTVRLRNNDYDRQEEKRTKGIDEVYREYGVSRRSSIRINFFGAWDTVGAMGLPNFKKAIDEVRKRYVDQICNIDEAHHAVALDDNRARIYTPVLMTYPHMNKNCGHVSIDDTVNEVWFSGAHSDVGGGYKEGLLPGLSMNWMITKLKGTGVGGLDIVPANAGVVEDELGIIHDVEGSGFFFSAIFKRMNRDIDSYLDESGYNKRTTTPHDPQAKLHISVINRFSELDHQVETNTSDAIVEAKKRGDNLVLLNASDLISVGWYEELRISRCLIAAGNGYTFDPSCIEIVRN